MFTGKPNSNTFIWHIFIDLFSLGLTGTSQKLKVKKLRKKCLHVFSACITEDTSQLNQLSNPLDISCFAIYSQETCHKDSKPCKAGGSSFALFGFFFIFMAAFCLLIIKEN